MNIEMDKDVQTVAEFMQRNIPASKLVATANAVNLLAPILWGRHADSKAEPIRALFLEELPIT